MGALEEPRTKRVRMEALEAFCVQAMLECGLDERDAGITAEVLVTTDAWGVHTHGTRQLRFLLRGVRAGRLSPQATPGVASDGPAWAIVDGHNAMPMVTACLAMDVAIEKARTAGIAYVGVKGSGHFGAAGYYANLAVREDMIGVCVSNSNPIVTVPGARGRILGANPLAFAIPAGSERSVWLDIALSTVAATKVLVAMDSGLEVPEGWIVDEDGLPSTEPNDFLTGGAMTPMADHKGYGLALLVEVLSAVLTGAAVTHQVPSWQADIPDPTNQGHAFIAIDVASIVPLVEFRIRMDRMIREIKAAPKAKGSDRIYLPGEIEWEKWDEAQELGIQLPDHVVGSLRGLAADCELQSRLEALLG